MQAEPTQRRYVRCTFPSSTREYTYHADGLDLTPGDQVQVETARGIATVTVTGFSDAAPYGIQTKPILGKALDQTQ